MEHGTAVEIHVRSYNNMTHWTIKLRNTLQHEAKLSKYC